MRQRYCVLGKCLGSESAYLAYLESDEFKEKMRMLDIAAQKHREEVAKQNKRIEFRLMQEQLYRLFAEAQK